MRVIECQQRTAEWFAIRCGRVTCSRLNAVVSRKKNGEPTAERTNYMWEVAAETITNVSTEHYVSQYMKHGMDFEDEAKSAYYQYRLADSDINVLDAPETGFVLHPTIDRLGCSPDILLPGLRGGAEIKCPQAYIHLQYRQAGEVPEEYKPQVFGAMACTGMDWWDFASYNRDFAKDKRLFVVRAERDDFYIKWLETEVQRFLEELDELVSKQ